MATVVRRAFNGLRDALGNVVRRERLTEEVAGATVGGVRTPWSSYPGDGLDPISLANLLRSADYGDPLRYFELAEQIEERDPHYLGVLGTRKRSVAQIDVTVEAASDDAEDVRRADFVREWLRRDELADETFDILDAIGKGVSFTEIMWDTSEGQWWPRSLEWRSPTWFTFDRRDGRTPLLRGGETGNGEDVPLEPWKFIQLAVKAKSGLPVRSGIARVATWGWMFKAFTLRDWAIFAQTFGQPVRVGKFHAGATKEDKATLFRAVANIAGDCAAIIPQGMEIAFIESKNVGSGSDLYEKRADWLDRQISKAVLGQTTTTDAVSGGHAVSQEHRQVQEDIETADCKALSAALNRDLIRPWMDLEFGPGGPYPRLMIARPKQEDLALLADAIPKLVGAGMRIQASEVRDKFGFSDPDSGAEILQPTKLTTDTVPARIALQMRQEPVADFPPNLIAARLVEETDADIGELVATVEAMVSQASSLDELKEMLLSAFPVLDTAKLGEKIALGLIAARAAGMSDVEDESA